MRTGVGMRVYAPTVSVRARWRGCGHDDRVPSERAVTADARPSASCPTGSAHGLDMTDEMLALARENARKAGVENFKFHKGYIDSSEGAGRL